jgi:hypothetical protein
MVKTLAESKIASARIQVKPGKGTANTASITLLAQGLYFHGRRGRTRWEGKSMDGRRGVLTLLRDGHSLPQEAQEIMPGDDSDGLEVLDGGEPMTAGLELSLQNSTENLSL